MEKKMIKKKIGSFEKITFKVSSETKKKFDDLNKKIVDAGYEADPEIIMSVILTGLEKIIFKIQHDENFQ